MIEFISKASGKITYIGVIIVLLFGLVVPSTIDSVNAESDKEMPDETVVLDPSYQHDSFDGWGTTLAWFSNVTGGWPDDIKNELADDLFSEEGLNFNIARYNIGGEDAPETEPYMRLGGAVPGYWNRPGELGPPEGADEDWEEQKDWWDPNDPIHWDWNKDENQQWWLKAAEDRGANLFEAFSNSPPYFMTESGYTSGNWDSWDDNLRSDKYEDFAIYLTRVVDYLQDEMNIDFHSLSPVNEPNNGYWGAKGDQEGSNWSNESQAKIINEVSKQMNLLDLDTKISAMDETNPQVFREGWNSYDDTTKDNIGQMNVHTYWPEQRSPIRDISKGEDRNLWMSEVDIGPDGIPQNFDDIEPGIEFSKHITSDIKNLEPEAWVMWQAIEDEVNMNEDNENMNWGLIHVDFDSDDFSKLEIHKNKKFYTMGNYTKFIRPGDQFINTDNENTSAAINTEDNRAVIVYTNDSDKEETIDFDLSRFETIGDAATATPYVTSEEENLTQNENIDINNDVLQTTVEPESVTTFVISDIAGVAEDFLSDDSGYKLFNANSDLVLDTDDNSLVQKENTRNEDNQEWEFEKVTDGHSNKEKYKIINGENGKILTNDDGTLLLDSDNGLPEQHWIISTNGLGEYTFVGAESNQLIEVVGESSDEGGEVNLYQPNAGSNQSWKLMSTKIDTTEMQILVEQYEKEDEFENKQAAHDLKLHLMAVSQYEKKEKSEKVVKHLKSFKQLLEYQKENELISEKVYDKLYDQTEFLIKEWQ